MKLQRPRAREPLLQLARDDLRERADDLLRRERLLQEPHARLPVVQHRALARILQQRLRKSDMIGRYGGEEFAAIFQDAGTEEARRIIDELRQDFAKVRFQMGEREFSCTFSAGISSYPGAATAETTGPDAFGLGCPAGAGVVVVTSVGSFWP